MKGGYPATPAAATISFTIGALCSSMTRVEGKRSEMTFDARNV